MSLLVSLLVFIFFFVKLVCYIGVIIFQYALPTFFIYKAIKLCTKPFRYSD